MISDAIVAISFGCVAGVFALFSIIGIIVICLDSDHDGLAGAISCSIIFTVMCLALINFGVWLDNAYKRTMKQEYHTLYRNIVSLDRDTVASGHFTFGCGTIENKTYYFYYYEVKPNTYKLDKIESSTCFIVETSEYQPSIYKVKEQGKYNFYYNIYVPEGAMVVQYNLRRL